VRKTHPTRFQKVLSCNESVASQEKKSCKGYLTAIFFSIGILEPMKKLLELNLFAFGFFLLAFNLSPVLALPFQEPIPGSYQCFIAGKDPFAVDVKDAGARLELRPDKTYTLSTTSASENGTFTTQSMEDDVEMTQLFQSGVGLELYPASGSAAYGGIFIIDKQGGLHTLVQNSGGVWIRCQSEGADLIAAIQNVVEEQAVVNETQSRAEGSGRVPALTPMNAVSQGTYQCYYSYDDYDIDTYQHTPEPFTEIFQLELFSGNQYICTSGGSADGCDDVSEDNTFEMKPDGTFTWLDGTMEIYYDDQISHYGQDANGIPTLVMYEEDEDPFTDNWLYHVIKCSRIGDTTTTPPSEQGTAEFQLLPDTIRAPQPPTGAGGLSGMYIDFTVRQTMTSVMGSNGMPFLQVDIEPPEYLYFLPNGYVYRSIYDWSYEDLDCTRMLKDGTPLCDMYIITDNGITFGSEGKALPFSKDNFNITIDGVEWAYQTPVDSLPLQGTFEHTGGYGGISISSSFYTFAPDGTFLVDRSSSVAYTTPEIGGATASVAGYNQDPTSTGKYVIRGNTLEFTYADGSTEKKVFNYSLTDTGQVDSIWLNGTVYWK
jgi:hypothetical protein